MQAKKERSIEMAKKNFIGVVIPRGQEEKKKKDQELTDSALSVSSDIADRMEE